MKSNKFLSVAILVVLAMVILLGRNRSISAHAIVSKGIENENDTLLHVMIQKETDYKNLSIYFLSGTHELDHVGYQILSEALEQKSATIKETGEVNELSVTNDSEYFIFINSGDIVKGGKQDRTIGVDLIISPHEKNVRLESFCVESGRWSQRGNEEVILFSVSEEVLPSRKLKMAARKNKNQSEVWGNIAEQQDKLSVNISSLKGSNIDVRSGESASSLQLTLENDDLDSIRNDFKMQFLSVPGENEEIIGFAYAVNGELYGADIYNSATLFRKMWPRLLNSVIVEAITDYKGDSISFNPPHNILEKLASGYSGDKKEEDINATTQSVTYERNEMIVFETYDKMHHDWLHKSFLMKDTTKAEEIYEIDFQRRDYRNRDDLQQRIEDTDIGQQE